MRFLMTLVAGIALGLYAYHLFYAPMSGADGQSAGAEQARQPLYWVAPMDPNFRRDKPGKSPMGMDLVPVYADEVSDSPGTVRITPEVQNNLGVKTAAVVKRELDMTIRAMGRVQYDENSLVHVHPRVSGWIDTLYVKAAGESVTRGQPLYALYSPELVNAQEEFLLARRRQNQALLEAARGRLRALQVPQQAIEQLAERGQVQQSVVFRAPQNGVVDNLTIREGF